MFRSRAGSHHLNASQAFPTMSRVHSYLATHRDVAMILCVAAIFIFAVVYSVLSATTISSNIDTDGTLRVSGAANASSTFQADGRSLFYGVVSAGAATNSPVTTLNVTGSGYFTVGLGVGYATTGSGNLLVNDLAVIRGRLGVNATTSPAVEFGVTGSGLFSTGLGVGYATTGSGNLIVNDLGVFRARLGVNATTSPALEFGVTGSGLFSGGLGVGYATTSGFKVVGLTVLNDRLGVNATTSPYKQLGVTGDIAAASAATTTVSAESTSTTQGGCIELKDSTGGRWIRIYPGSSSATTTSTHVLISGGTGLLVIEPGRCQ